MSLYEAPPEALEIDGEVYPIDTDFRRWIEFQSIMTAGKDDAKTAERLYGFMERMGLPPSKETLDAMMVFFLAESKENAKAGGSRSISFDFGHDSEYIYAAFRGAYGIDLTTENIHWWRFKALFKALPDDCEICKIMRYRATPLQSVPKEQRKFYREMKARYALAGAPPAHRTEQEMKDYVKRRFAEAQAAMEKEQQSP